MRLIAPLLLCVALLPAAADIDTLPWLGETLSTIRDDKLDSSYTGLASSYESVLEVLIDSGGTISRSSGVLIHEDWLLVAAHSIDGTITKSRIELHDGSTRFGSLFYTHPSWTGDFDDGYDIGLVKLSSSITASEVTPAKLTGVDPSTLLGKTATIAGWGRPARG